MIENYVLSPVEFKVASIVSCGKNKGRKPVNIIRKYKELVKKNLSYELLSTSLESMEERGLVEKYEYGKENVEGIKYRITSEGRKALKENRKKHREWANFSGHVKTLEVHVEFIYEEQEDSPCCAKFNGEWYDICLPTKDPLKREFDHGSRFRWIPNKAARVREKDVYSYLDNVTNKTLRKWREESERLSKNEYLRVN